MALSHIPHLDFTGTTPRFRPWNQIAEKFKLGMGQVARICFTHVARSVLCILLFAAYTLVSFFTDYPTFKTSSEIESKYGSWLEKLTPSQKSAWAIALLTEAVEPEGIEVDYSIDGIPQLKQLFKLSDGCKLHLALAVLMYLRDSVLAESRAGKC